MEEDLIDFNIEDYVIQTEPRRLNVRWTREVEAYIGMDFERSLIEEAFGIPEKFLYRSSWTHDYLSRTKKIRQMEVE